MFKFIATTNPVDVADPAHTVGVEVTTPEVAALLAVNVDGQHGLGRCSYEALQLSMWLQGTMRAHPAQDAAIAIATHILVPAQFRRAMPPEWLDPSLGPATPFDDWRVFVTTRPDLDSIGAMAVLVIRSLGFWPQLGSGAEDAVRDRVRAIAEADAFTPSAEWAPSPLPTEENPWPRAGSVDSAADLAHLGMICSPRRGDVTLPLAERVAVIACWLLFGVDGLPMNQTDEDGPVVSAIYKACGVEPWIAMGAYPLARIMVARERVLESRKALAREAQREGAIELDIGIPNCCAFPELGHRHPGDGVQCGNCGAWCPLVAVVRVAHAGAMGLGYCVAPVVIAFDQVNQGKVTIAAYSSRYLDVPALRARLGALEPGWGGGTTIIGSPQGAGTKLPDETIIAYVRACRS